MKLYEYHVQRFYDPRTECAGLAAWLNAKALDGWRLVAVMESYDKAPSDPTFIFEREVNP